MPSNLQPEPGDDARDRRLAETEILLKIAHIEKAAVSAQVAALRTENQRLEDLLAREAQARQRLRNILEIAESALTALRREHEETKRELSGRLDQAHRRIRRLVTVAATETGRAFIAAALEGPWPLRRWLLRHRANRLRQSNLVDAAWYLANNADVAEAGMDPVLHYLHHGAEEGRAPNPALEDPPEEPGR